MCVCNPKIDPDVSNTMTPLCKLCNNKDDNYFGRKYGYVTTSSYQRNEMTSKVTYTSASMQRACNFQYNTQEVMGMCLPSLTSTNYQTIVVQNCNGGPCGISETLTKNLTVWKELSRRWLMDVAKCWVPLLIACLCAIVWASILFFLIQQPIGVRIVLWSTVLILLLICLATGAAAHTFKNRSERTPTLPTNEADTISFHALTGVAIFAGVSAGLKLAFNIYVTTQSFERMRVDMPELDLVDDAGVAIKPASVSEVAARTLVLAGKAIQLVPSLLWSTIIQVTCVFLLLSFWFFVAFCLASAGTIKVDANTGVSHLEWDTPLRYTLIFQGLSWLWIMELIDAIVLIIAGGVVAIFVFAPTIDGRPNSDDRVLPNHPLWHTFITMGKFHLGTMVGGATCIMVLRPFRVITDLVHWFRFGSGVPNSRWDSLKDRGTCTDKCQQCWLKYFHHWTRGADKRALVQTILHGTPFFTARNATWHLNKHYGRYMSVPLYAAKTAMSITNMNVGLLCALLGHWFIASGWCGVQLNDLQCTLMPLGVCFLFGYVIGWAFITHLDAAVTTELVGFAEAKLRLFTPGVPQLTVPQDLVLLCEENQSREALQHEYTALRAMDQDHAATYQG